MSRKVLSFLVLASAAPLFGQVRIPYPEAVLTQSVQADYRNPWFMADPAPPQTEPLSTTFFGGAVCGAPGMPPRRTTAPAT
jgi:hypothetical protein